MVGWNFKYTDMQGVVGIEQMKKLPWRVERMKAIWLRYCSHLDGLEGLQPMVRHEKVQPGWIPWFIDVYTADAADRDALAEYLKEEKGIGTRKVYPPIHTQVAYRTPEFPDQPAGVPEAMIKDGAAFPVTVERASTGLWLPSSTKLTDDEIDRICEGIRGFFAQRGRAAATSRL